MFELLRKQKVAQFPQQEAITRKKTWCVVLWIRLI